MPVTDATEEAAGGGGGLGGGGFGGGGGGGGWGGAGVAGFGFGGFGVGVGCISRVGVACPVADRVGSAVVEVGAASNEAPGCVGAESGAQPTAPRPKASVPANAHAPSDARFFAGLWNPWTVHERPAGPGS